MYVTLVPVRDSFHICLKDLSLCSRILLALPSRFPERRNHGGATDDRIEGGVLAVLSLLLAKPFPFPVFASSANSEVGNDNLLPRRRNERADM
jgi:hypothetical protein